MTDVATSGAGPARVSGADDPARDVDWKALEKIRITGHDGIHARLYCYRCPATQPTYGVSGSLTGIITWATQHYHFMHEGQDEPPT